jgi:hypothetical protein
MIRSTKRVNPPAPFNHLDAYELPDGTIAFSARGAVAAITGGGGPRNAQIERYARGMIAERGGAELRAVEFITPDGGSIAKGIPLDELADLVSWYAGKFARGELKPNQLEIGRTCVILQNVAARVGWETTARSWFGRVVSASEVPIIQAAALMRERTRWEAFYPWSLCEALAKFVRCDLPFDRSKGWPAWMSWFHAELHVVLLGREMAEEAKAIRDDVGNETIHQGFSDELKDAIRSYLPMLITVAELTSSKEEWIRSVATLVRRRRDDETPFGRKPSLPPGERASRQVAFADLLP